MKTLHGNVYCVHALLTQKNIVTEKKIDEVLKQTNDNVYILYSLPTHYLADRIESGAIIEEASKAWIDGAQKAIEMRQKNRQRIHLLCIQDAVKNSMLLENKTGLQANYLSKFSDKPSVTELMMSYKVVFQDQEIKRSLKALKGVSMKFSDNEREPLFDIELVLTEYHRLKDENEIIFSELQKLQELYEEKEIEYENIALNRNQENGRVSVFDNSMQIIQQKTSHLRNALAAAQRELLELRIQKTSKSLLSKGRKIKQALSRNQQVNMLLPNWLSQQIEMVEKSTYFDMAWYLEQYPDIQEIRMNPAEHFVRYGGFENRSPGPNFDTDFYTLRYPDVLAQGINPLVHYILYGEAQGRLIRAPE